MIVFLLISALIFIFGFVILYGAPYLPTLRKQAEEGLELLDLKPGQTLLELGSGDGRVMRMAAARGLRVVGYELNPILVAVSYLVTWRYRRQVKIIWGSFWSKPWPESDGAFVFLIDRFMERLDKRAAASKNGPKKLVSFAFRIPDKEPDATKNGLYLYKY